MSSFRLVHTCHTLSLWWESSWHFMRDSHQARHSLRIFFPKKIKANTFRLFSCWFLLSVQEEEVLSVRADILKKGHGSLRASSFCSCLLSYNDKTNTSCVCCGFPQSVQEEKPIFTCPRKYSTELRLSVFVQMWVFTDTHTHTLYAPKPWLMKEVALVECFRSGSESCRNGQLPRK